MRLNSLVVITSFIGLTVSFWNRNALPGNIDYIPELSAEPLQTTTRQQAFTTTYRDVDYVVEPEFAYELHGMIVSYRHHDGMSRMHRASNDHLNMLDVCVVWGDNTENHLLHRIKFWNGIFTCNFQTNDLEAWNLFDIYQVSNNHLISDDIRIRDGVLDVQVGDQIHVSGYLASYGSTAGGMRGTSTTRLDTGDGACETIFVDRFEIIRPAISYWRISMYTAAVLLFLSLIIHFRRPYRPYRSS